MPHKALTARARALENEFFARRDQEKIAALRQEIEERAARAGLSDVSGILDEAVLDRLIELGVTAETMAAMSLVPLVLVAWADGKLDDKEREAILQAAESKGVEVDTPARALLVGWLAAPPKPVLRESWGAYVAEMCSHLDADAIAKIKQDVVARTREIAEATGGILGFGSKISGVEQDALDDLASAFG